MKKMLPLMLLFIAILLLAGCASGSNLPVVHEEETATAQPGTGPAATADASAPSITTDNPSTDEATAITTEAIHILHAPTFTSTWAKNHTHFFFPYTHVSHEHTQDELTRHIDHALYRLPLEDISQGEPIPLPGVGDIEIVGISEEYLFASRRHGIRGEWYEAQQYDVYRISLNTLETTLVDAGQYLGIPFFHGASNTILFTHGDFEAGRVWIESYQVDAGTRDVFFEFESNNIGMNAGWWHAKDNGVVFILSSWGAGEPGSDFIFISAGLETWRVENGIDIVLESENEPRSPAEEYILERDGLWQGEYAVAGDFFYYLWTDEEGNRHFSRINLDGTEDIVLEENTGVRSLLGVNNTLFATVFAQTSEGGEEWQEAVMLSNEGGIVQVLGGGEDGHNSAFVVRQLGNTDLVMILELNFFTIDGQVAGLYCTATGALFSFYSSFGDGAE